MSNEPVIGNLDTGEVIEDSPEELIKDIREKEDSQPEASNKLSDSLEILNNNVEDFDDVDESIIKEVPLSFTEWFALMSGVMVGLRIQRGKLGSEDEARNDSKILTSWDVARWLNNRKEERGEKIGPLINSVEMSLKLYGDGNTWPMEEVFRQSTAPDWVDYTVNIGVLFGVLWEKENT